MPSLLQRAAGELLSPAMIVAGLALTLSMGGTAYAAKLITSQDIKNNTVRSVDVRNGALTGADLKDGSVGLADLSPAVKSAISATWDPSRPLVPGRTITGSVYYRIDASSAGQALNQSIALPARAPKPLASASFAVDGSDVSVDDDAACTGTYNAPTAPAGRLCGYFSSSANLTSASLDTLTPGLDKGFIVRGTAAGAGSTMIDFSWAYTAPTS